MKQSVSQIVEERIAPIVNELGYELIEVEYTKKITGMNLTVFIDSEKGIGLDDCEKVHKTIDPVLDELDPTNGASYVLNVSSCGLDRPLKTDKELNLNLSKMIDVDLYAKIDGNKHFEGELVTFDATNLTLKTANLEIKIPRDKISKITKHISF